MERNPLDATTRAAQMSLPNYIDKEAWEGFVEMRKSMSKKGWTPRAEKMALNMLEKYYNQGHNVNDILDQSVFNCWKGLFPVKGETNGQSNGFSNRPVSRRDSAREAIAALTGGDTGESTAATKLRVIK